MFYEESKVGWTELAPSLQALFKDGLEKHVSNSRKNLNDEIEREKNAIKKIQDDIIDNINRIKSDQFGAGGVKGRVLKYDLSSLYANDHFFNIEITQGNKPDWLYRYNFTSGECYDNNGVKTEIPWRSFLYEPSTERLWYYWEPEKYEEIKLRYIKKTTTSTTNPSNLLTSGFDTYDKHVRYYKIYDNGWCEQVGGYSHYQPDLSNTNDWRQYYCRYVTFKIPFKDTNYIATIGGELWPYTTSVCTHGYGTYTKYPDRMMVSICGGNPDEHWRFSTYHVAGFVDLQALGYNI